MLQCDAVCCNVLQCVAMCCNVLQCVAICCNVLQCVAVRCSVFTLGIMYFTLVSLLFVAVRCSAFIFLSKRHSLGRRVAEFLKSQHYHHVV